jgi:Carboxypeptidase regulatory-like domain
MTSPQPKSSPVAARKAALVLALVLLVIGLPGCAARRITADYVFSVTGVVRTQDEAPLQGADVTLEVNGPIYEAIDLVRNRHVLTTENGGFVFAYISHQDGVKYTITVHKEGFEPQTVSGAAPPNGNHVIKLKKASEPASSDAAGGSLSSHYSLPTAHYSLPSHV